MTNSVKDEIPSDRAINASDNGKESSSSDNVPSNVQDDITPDNITSKPNQSDDIVPDLTSTLLRVFHGEKHESLLHCASRNNAAQILVFLLDQGADPTIKYVWLLEKVFCTYFVLLYFPSVFVHLLNFLAFVLRIN